MPAHADYGTQERLAKHRWILEGDEQPHIKILDAVKLDWYLLRNYIDDTQHWAGLRFRADFLVAGWEYRQVGGYAEWIDRGSESPYAPGVRLDAKDRVKCALMALPILVIPVVVSVCGLDEFCGSRKVSPLCLGLDYLTEHYEGKRR